MPSKVSVAYLAAAAGAPLARIDLNIVDASDEEAELLALAWSFLRMEIGLASYAESIVVHGHYEGLDLINAIMGRLTPAYRFEMSASTDFSMASYLCRPERPVTYVSLVSFLSKYLMQFKAANAVGDSDKRLLVVMDLAGTMLHEAAHSYCVAAADGDPDELCYNSYMIENTFRWAALKRYAALATHPCVVAWLGSEHRQGHSTSYDPRGDVDFLWGFGGAVFLTDPGTCL